MQSMSLARWKEGRILPYVSLSTQLMKGNLNLGCHTGFFSGLCIPYGLPNNPEWLKANPASIDYYGSISMEGIKQAQREMMALPEFKKDVLEYMVRAYNFDGTPTKLFYIASDNLDYVSTRGNGSYFSTRDFVEYLVDTKGWGVSSSHIGRNPNYQQPHHPAHNVQIWILTPPKFLSRLYPSTRFSRNLTKDKLATVEWFNFQQPEKQELMKNSPFMNNTDYTFKKYIGKKIKLLKNIPELFNK